MALRNRYGNGEVGSRHLVAWSRALIFRLIDALRDEPMLWNPQHPHFKHRTKKTATLERIAQDLELPLPAVRQKIDVLKATFHKFRRTLQARGDGDPPNKMWFAYERLLFLAPDYQADATCSVLNPKVDEEETTYSIAYNTQEEESQKESPQAIPLQAYDPPTPSVSSSVQRSRSECSQTVVEKLLQVIVEGTSRNQPTWANVLESTVGLMVRQAGPRPEPEMWRLQDSLVHLMRRFHNGEFAEERLEELPEDR